MVKIRVVRELAFKAPELRLDQHDKDRVARVVLGDVLNNIKQQKQADGSPLKRNNLGTLRRKQAEGKEPWSLVDEEHRFVRPANWLMGWTGEKTLTVEPGMLGGDPPLDELVEKVQRAGYTGWFAMSAAGFEAVQVLLKQFIKNAIRRRPR